MMRKLSFGLAAVCLASLLVTPPVLAGEGNALLNAVPGDAWAVISVRSLAEFDKKLSNLSMMANAPMAGMSYLAMAKGMLGFMSGIDDNGSAALVVMPAETPETISQHLVFLLPVSDYSQLFSMQTPEDVGDGVSKILVSGSDTYAAQKGSFAILGPTVESVNAVRKSTTGVVSKFTPHQLARWSADDLTLWGNFGDLTASPMFDMASAMAQGSGMSLDWLRDFQAGQLSLAFGPEGIKIGVYYNAKPGTPMAKAMASVKPPAGSLLTGLPADGFVGGMGSVSSKENSEYGAAYCDKMFAEALQSPEAPPFLGTLQPLVHKMVASFRSVAVSVNQLKEGSDGVLSVTAVVSVDGGSDAFLGSIGETIAAVRAGLSEENAAMMDSALEHKRQAEGGSVDHLVIHPEALDATEEDVATMNKVLGSEGLLIRMAPVTADRVAFTLGGGPAQAEGVAALVKGSQAPLADSAVVKAAAVPADRVAEGYLSANGVMDLATAIAQATGDMAPPPMPPVDKPVSFFSRAVEGGGLQTDIVLPIELIKALSQMAMGMMGPGAGPGPAGGPGGPPN